MTIGRIHGLPFAVFGSRRTRRNEIDLGPSPFTILFRVIAQGIRRRNQRMAMARLSDHLLRDIGMTRAEAEWDVDRPKQPR
jgi:uncharacterized protein YjiS (DUF1127 family)